MRNSTVGISASHHIQWFVYMSPVYTVRLESLVHPGSYTVLLLRECRHDVFNRLIPSTLALLLLWLCWKFSVTHCSHDETLSVGVAAIIGCIVYISVPFVPCFVKGIGDSLHGLRVLVTFHVLYRHDLRPNLADELSSTCSSLLVKLQLFVVVLRQRVVLADRGCVEILHLSVYLAYKFLRVYITHIGSHDMVAEIVTVHTAYLLVILYCHHWVDDTLQAFLNKTATAKVSSCLNESAIKVLQGEFRVTLNSFCNMYSLFVSLLPSLRFLHH